jgi:hypothetical protein
MISEDIPNEIFEQIFTFLPLSDLLMVKLISCRMNSLIESEGELDLNLKRKILLCGMKF